MNVRPLANTNPSSPSYSLLSTFSNTEFLRQNNKGANLCPILVLLYEFLRPKLSTLPLITSIIDHPTPDDRYVELRSLLVGTYPPDILSTYVSLIKILKINTQKLPLLAVFQANKVDARSPFSQARFILSDGTLHEGFSQLDSTRTGSSKSCSWGLQALDVSR